MIITQTASGVKQQLQTIYHMHLVSLKHINLVHIVIKLFCNKHILVKQLQYK